MDDARDSPRAAERQRRLAEALRANLRRRKARARAAGAGDPDAALRPDALPPDAPSPAAGRDDS